MLVTADTYRDYAYLKKLGKSYKLIKCNQVKRKGLEVVEVKKEADYLYQKKGYKADIYKVEKNIANWACENPCVGKVHDTGEDEKLANNICRARNKVFEYVMCNDFKYFVTLTLAPDKYNREDIKVFNHDLNIFIRDYNKRKNANIKFLLIPERHKDGCWHMHGFIMGLPEDRLVKFDIHGSRKLPMYIVNKAKKGQDLFFFPEYEKRFGFNIFEPIRNKKASVLYMSKYLTKDISRNVTELGGHLYYCSKGLKKAEIVKQGQFLDAAYQFDFANQYGGQSFFDALSADQLTELENKIGGDPITIDDYRKGYRNKNGWNEYMDIDTGEIIGTIPEVLHVIS